MSLESGGLSQPACVCHRNMTLRNCFLQALTQRELCRSSTASGTVLEALYVRSLSVVMLKSAPFSIVSTAIFTALTIIALRVLCTEQYAKSGIITLHVRAGRYSAAQNQSIHSSRPTADADTKRSTSLMRSSASLHPHRRHQHRIHSVCPEILGCFRVFNLASAALSPQQRLGLLMYLARHRAR